jgi:hypothetical protein
VKNRSFSNHVLRLLSEAEQSPQRAILKFFQSMLSLGLRDHVSHKHKTNEAFTISHTLLFTFVENTREDKKSGLSVHNNSTE